MFMQGADYATIASALLLEREQVVKWSLQSSWNKQRVALINEAAIDIQPKLKEIIQRNILEVASRQLVTSEMIDSHIHAHLIKPKLGTKALSDISRAAVSSASIASKVVGLERATEDVGRKPATIQFNLQVNVGGQKENASVTIETAPPSLPASEPDLPDPFEDPIAPF